MPIAETLAAEIEARIRVHADPVRASGERRYLKSDLVFIGAGVPAVRAATRAFAREHSLDRPALLALVRALWATPVHERRVAAIELLTGHGRLLAGEDLALVEALIRDSRSWAYVDALATGVAGVLVERDPRLAETLDRWAGDGDFWVRRSALLALLGPLRRGAGDWERFARYADAMIEEREFFIRKAIGWVLRETAKRCPALVYEWLAARAARASGVTVREAVKYLPAEQREEVLAAYREGHGERQTTARRAPA